MYIYFVLDMDRCETLEKTIGQLNVLLSSVQDQYTTDGHGFFARDEISSLGKYISIVADLFRSLDLSHDDQWKPYLEVPSFANLRARWNDFLSQLDDQPVLSSSSPHSVPSDLQLLNIATNQPIALRDIYSNHDRTLFVFLRHLA